MKNRVFKARSAFSGLRYRLALGLFFILATLNIVSPAVSFAEKQNDQGEIWVSAVVVKEFPPQYITDETGRPAGFAIDTMNRISELAGLKITYVTRDTWTEVSDTLKQGRAGLIPNLGISKERMVDFDFTTPIETFPISIIIRSDTTSIYGPGNLLGKSVGYVKFNVGQKIVKNTPGVTPVEFANVSDALFALLSAQVDALIYPLPVILKKARDIGIEDLIKAAGAPVKEIKRAIAVRRGDEKLLNRLNKAIEVFVKSDEYRYIYVKWYGKEKPYWTPTRIIMAAIAVMSLILISMAVWRYYSIQRMNNNLLESINERRKVEMALRESEERYKLAQKVAQIGAWNWNLNTGEVIWSAEIESMLGLEPETLGYTFDAFETYIYPEDLIDVKRVLNECLLKKSNFSIDHRVTGKDGGLRWVASYGAVITDANNRSIFMSGVMQEITERKAAEDEIIKSRERFATVMDSLDAFVYVSDIESHRFLYVNKALKDQLDCDDPEGRLCREELEKAHPDICEHCANEQLVDRLGEPAGMYTSEYHNKKSDRWYYVRDRAIRWEDGRAVRISIMTDITERKRAERKALDQERSLIQADRLKSMGIMVSGVAHEINNPNSFITLNAPLLGKIWDGVSPVLDKRLEEKGDFSLDGITYSKAKEMVPRLVEGITDGARRIERIVTKLKSFVREKQTSEKRQGVKINDAIRNSVELMESLIKTNTRRFSVELADNLPDVIANQQEIEQVLINLISNACQALDSKDKAVSVKTHFEEVDNYIVIEVADQGHGIPEEYLKKIIDPFFTTKRDAGGTGLGLSISLGIINNHNGVLEFASKQTGGTIATVKLPVAKYGESNV